MAKACKVCGWVLEMKSSKSRVILKRHITDRHSVHKDCANDYIMDLIDPSEVSTCNQCHSNYSSSDFLKRHKDCCAKESLMTGKTGTQHLVDRGENKSSTIEPRLPAIPLMADSPCKVCGKIFEDNIQLFGHMQCDHKLDRQLSEQQEETRSSSEHKRDILLQTRHFPNCQGKVSLNFSRLRFSLLS